MAGAPNKVQTPHDDLTYKIIGVAMAVHNELGPGFPEEIYHRAMAIGLHADGIPYESEYRINLHFRGTAIGSFALDFVAGRSVVVELKAVSALAAVHQEQIIAYLAASGLPVGLLINFGAASLETRRLFPPKAVQASAAYQSRKAALE
jgi:GxxExxY protein